MITIFKSNSNKK